VKQLRGSEGWPVLIGFYFPSAMFFDYPEVMKDEPSALIDWTAEQLAAGRRWIETWKLAGADLERIRRKELRALDTYRTIALLCGPADYRRPPHAPKPSSGLVEQQRWFMKAARRD
jgi:hypothetical protein